MFTSFENIIVLYDELMLAFFFMNDCFLHSATEYEFPR